MLRLSPKLTGLTRLAACIPTAFGLWACTPALEVPSDLGLLPFLNREVSVGTPQNTISGSILGLSSQIVLSLNGGNDLTVTGNGTFIFPATVAQGSTYQVTVKSQPSAPVEYCSVSRGFGTLSDSVTDIEVTCFQLPDTGQSDCYSAAGGIQACGATPAGQDADFPSNPAVIQFIPTGSGSVRETSSMLLWQQCARGSLWTGATCTGAPTTTSWSNAVAYCAGLTLAGQSWRLPSVRELLLWPNYGLSFPAAPTATFVNTPTSTGSRFWTSTVNALNTTRAWTVDVSLGNTEDHPLGNGAYVRCVSGPSMPTNRFSAGADDVVYDQSTNLTWTRCSITNFGPPGTVGSGVGCTASPGSDDWEAGVNACATLVHAGRTDWRLPSVRELATLLDFSRNTTPLIQTAFFPNTGSANYRTSTTADQAGTEAWIVDFSTFVIRTADKSSNYRARCVATGL